MKPTVIRLGGLSKPILVETFEDAYSNAKGRGRQRRVERQKQRAEIKVAKQENKAAKQEAKASRKLANQEARQLKKDTRVLRRDARKDSKVAAKAGRKLARQVAREDKRNLRAENRLLRKSARKASRYTEDDVLPEDELLEDDTYFEEENGYEDDGYDDEGYEEEGYEEEGYDDEEYDDQYDEYADDGYDDDEYYDESEEEEYYNEASGAKEEMITDLMESPFSGDMSYTPMGNDDIRDMSFSEASGKGRRIRRTKKTIIRNVENPIISPNRIVVPAEERSSGANYGVDGTRTGLIGLDCKDDYDAPEKRQIYLNADGSGKTVAGINVKSAVIGILGAAALIIVAHKSGLLKK